MKQIYQTMLFIISISILGLCGCNTMSNEESVVEAYIIFDAYNSFATMYHDTWIDWSVANVEQLDSEEGTISISTNQKYFSIEDVKNATELICTEEYAQKEFYDKMLGIENPVFYMKNGVLYRTASEVMFYYPSGTLVSYEVLERNDNTITAKLGYVSSIENNQEDLVEVVVVNENNKWLIQEIRTN